MMEQELQFVLPEGEKFIFLLQRDRLDYTKWRKNLFSGLSAEEISRRAMEHVQKK